MPDVGYPVLLDLRTPRTPSAISHIPTTRVVIKYVTARTEASIVPRNSAVQLLIGYRTMNSPAAMRSIENAFEFSCGLVRNEFAPDCP